MLASSGSLWDGESGRRVSGRRHTVVFTAPVETRKRKNIAAVGARKGAAAGEAKKRKVVGGKKDVDVEDVTIKTTRRRSGKVERAVEERTKTSKPRRRSGRGAGTAIPVASGKVYSAEFSDEE